ncbi:MAG: hypothetical protein GY820_24000, partial [Gammaproteobacteria bacterium]|nr:hypothetical protein [Gammaproteobacteria bacterium]
LKELQEAEDREDREEEKGKMEEEVTQLRKDRQEAGDSLRSSRRRKWIRRQKARRSEILR